MDSKRAEQIMQSSETVQVLYQGSPVWIESIKDNNTAEITYIDGKRKIEVPIYLLVENNPVNQSPQWMG